MTDEADWHKDWQRRFQQKRAVMAKKEGVCDQEADREFLRGIEEFNAGNWFACHEVLEELWVGETGTVRDLYQGILQVAVALHHWKNGNYRGVMLLFDSGVKLLRHVEPACQGVDVTALIAATERVREALESLGEARMLELDRTLVPRVRLVRK
jgi:predicted metal-dependent hydrolase